MVGEPVKMTPEARKGIEAAFLRVVRKRLPGQRVRLRDDPHTPVEGSPSAGDDDRLEAAA